MVGVFLEHQFQQVVGVHQDRRGDVGLQKVAGVCETDLLELVVKLSGYFLWAVVEVDGEEKPFIENIVYSLYFWIN